MRSWTRSARKVSNGSGSWEPGKPARPRAKYRYPIPIRGGEYVRELSGFPEEDVCGSPFAVKAYRTHADFGGDEALARLRKRMSGRGLKLLMDFAVNHCAPDNPWADSHPDIRPRGGKRPGPRTPQLGTLPRDGSGKESDPGYGRDPYSAGWPDTLQLGDRPRRSAKP